MPGAAGSAATAVHHNPTSAAAAFTATPHFKPQGGYVDDGIAESGFNKRVPEYTEAQEKEIRKWFEMIAGNDRVIDQSELMQFLQRMGGNPSKTEVADILARYDKNDDGVLTVDEFIYCCRRLQIGLMDAGEVADTLRDAFRFFDRNGDGYVSTKELRKALSTIGDKLTKAESAKLFKRIDANNDGKISYEEFVSEFTAKMPKFGM